jgi:NADPH-dependent 2,4-dienoyl-CoA reductase/sulfur reductase-like enzyme/peroxiredoxin family protein/TusA-related sulfurtransferase/rhodanese-related sulfurtransferase
MNKKTIIIGGVAGGATAAARLRRLDEFQEIIVLERGEYISFANCGLPYYIGGVIQNREALILQNPVEMGEKFRLDIRIFNEVTKIDPVHKTVSVLNIKTQETYEETYDNLIISTGAFPIKPPIKGIDEAKNLFTLRNIPDTDQIKAYIETFKPRIATVIGAGFIGIEMAENLHHLGMKVNLVEAADQVMAPIDFEMAAIVHQHIINKGVQLILSDGVNRFENGGKQVVLSSGKVLNQDLIIFAIGVRPENNLAKAAGLKLGARGGIVVDDHLKTSDPSIYAIGDVIEVFDGINHSKTMIALAGPANKQARIVADNIVGDAKSYPGTMGTSVAKVFDYAVGATGNNEKTLKALNMEYDSIHIHPGSHAGYYPGSSTLSMKILYNPKTLEIYGAQAVGIEGVDKRIDVIATAIYAKLKVTDLKDLELSYAPPFSSAKDPVNMLGFVAENKTKGLVSTFGWNEIDTVIKNQEVILDVREPIEYELGHLDGAINIPVSQLRKRLSELPKDRTLHIYCQSGIRAYNASRILMQYGFTVKNLDGGYKSFQCLFTEGVAAGCVNELDDFGNLIIEEPLQEEKPMTQKTVSLQVDACGLQCPGPIVSVYKSLQTLNDGDILEIKATDPGFLKDIKNWADKTKNTLLDIHTDGAVITARIQKGLGSVKTDKDVVVTSNKENTTIVVFSQDLDKAIAAFIIATGAASMGKKVSLFFTFWGLNILRRSKQVKVKKSFIEKMFGFMMPRGAKKLPISNMNMMGMGSAMIKGIMKKKNVDSLPVLMKNAQELGVEIIACAMSMDIMGIKKEELIDGITIAGVATYLGETTEANHNLFI